MNSAHMFICGKMSLIPRGPENHERPQYFHKWWKLFGVTEMSVKQYAVCLK